MNLNDRFNQCRRSLWKDISRGPFESGTELLGWIELSNGKVVQLHLTMLTDDLEFIDVDAPTGCADDLLMSEDDFK